MSRERRPYLPLDVEEAGQELRCAPGEHRRVVREDDSTIWNVLACVPQALTTCLYGNSQAFQELAVDYAELETRHLEALAKLEAAEQEARRLTTAAKAADLRADRLSSDINTAHLKISALEDEVAHSEKEQARLATAAKAAESRAAELSSNLATARSKISALEEEVTCGKKEQERLATAAKAADLRAAQLTSSFAAASSKISTLQDEAVHSKKERASLAAAAEAAELQAADLSSTLATTSLKVEHLEGLLAQRENDQTRLTADLASAKNLAAELEGKLHNAEHDCEHATAEADSLAQAYASEQSAKVAANAKRKTLEKELADAATTMRAMDNAIAELQQQVDAQETSTKITNGVHQEQHIWDSAEEISRPATDEAATVPARKSTESGESVPAGSKDVLEQLRTEGASAGWLVPPKQVERHQVLGKGSFGTTYLGSFNGSKVAVKCVSMERDIEAKIVIRETAALSRLRDSNVMAFMGAVIQPPSCWLILEYLPGGTLADWLHGKDGRGAPKRSMIDKITMGLEIAKGMLVLEATYPPIIHRDLKPANILLDAAGKPKVADFGLCREFFEDEAYNLTGETGSYTYMSPEMMRSEVYSPKTDVHSFGVLFAEVIKQRPPFEELYLTPMQVAEGVAYDSLRPPLPRNLSGDLKFLLEACWAEEPEMRPDFAYIVGYLTDVRKGLSA